MSHKDNIRIMLKVIHSFGRRIPPDQRQDIMQSAILRCLEKHRDAYDQKFTTSLYRFTIWACSNYVRQSRKRRHPSLPLCGIAAPVDENREDIDHIYECMDKLASDDRVLIEQYFLMGMTLKEIGMLNGYTPQAAMQNVQRATQRLRRFCLMNGV